MPGPIEKVLVHIDGTEESMNAARYAIMLAKATGASLAAVYVINTRALADLVKARIFLKEEELEYERDIEADAVRYLNHFAELARKHGVTVDTIKASGAVSLELKRIVGEQRIDLLVIGELSQIRSRRDEFFNEAERAMRGVMCSVLIVKDEDRVWDLFGND